MNRLIIAVIFILLVNLFLFGLVCCFFSFTHLKSQKSHSRPVYFHTRSHWQKNVTEKKNQSSLWDFKLSSSSDGVNRKHELTVTAHLFFSSSQLCFFFLFFLLLQAASAGCEKATTLNTFTDNWKHDDEKLNLNRRKV